MRPVLLAELPAAFSPPARTSRRNARKDGNSFSWGEDFLKALNLSDEIVREQERKEAAARTIVLGAFLQLLGFIVRRARIAGSPENSALFRIGRLLAAMDRNCARDWSLDSMASFVHMSQSDFRRKFLAATGRTPIAWLLRLRLQKAARLLRLSASIGETAMSVGFADTNYFSRQFRALYEISPRELRRREGLPNAMRERKRQGRQSG